MNTAKAKKAIYSTAVLGMLMLAPQAMAAGSSVGNATLEELKQLIMEQQKQISAQDKAIKALQTGKGAMAGGMAMPMKKMVKSGKDKVSLTLYGQVNRAMMFADDGEESEVYHVDNDNSSTRFGMKGSAKANDDLSAGFKFEMEYEGNSSDSVSQEGQDVSASLKQRHMDFYLKSKQFGKLSIGQGDTASNGTSEVDLSGTKVIGYSDSPKMGKSVRFYDSRADTYVIGVDSDGDDIFVDAGDVMSNMDGLSRLDRLRYDTPTWNGFSVATSTVERNGNDVALRYSGKIGGAKLAGAVAYARMGDNDSDVDTTINGSVSVLLANGLNATFAAGSQDLDSPAPGHDDPTFMYGKLGYIAKIFDIGTTAFAIDYTQHDDVGQAGDEADSFGIMAVQKFNDLGTELYASYRQISLDRTGLDLEDIDVMMAGARIKF